jgi:hypothetical protein
MESVDRLIDLQKIMIECGHTQHLTRERSITKYVEKYKSLIEEGCDSKLFEFIFQTLNLMFASSEWEYRYGAIQIAVKTLEHTKLPPEDETYQEVRSFLFDECRVMLSDPEFRVRNNIGDIMQKLIKIDGAKIYEDFKEHLFCNISETFNRDPKGVDASSNACMYSSQFDHFQNHVFKFCRKVNIVYE